MPSTYPSFSIVQNPTRDLTPTLHHRRSISYDDHSNCSHMPMLTKFMTCIFPPSYFLFLLFVFFPYIPLFISSILLRVCLPISVYILSVLARQPSLSRLALCAIFISISHSRPSTHTSVVPHVSSSNFRRALDTTILILISHSYFPLHHPTSPTSLATKIERIYLSDILFPHTHITSSYSTLPLMERHVCLLA